jgi:hypothetical protein
MAKAKFDIKAVDLKTVQNEAQKSAERAFYAGIGVTDRAVEVLRTYLADAQQRAQKRLGAAQHDVTARVAGVQKSLSGFEPQAFRAEATRRVGVDAKARRAAIEKRVSGLQAEAFAVPARLQKAVDANVERGETLVGRIRRQQSTKDAVTAAETTVTKAKTTKTQAKKAVKKSTASTKQSTAAARGSAKATATSARKTAEAVTEAVADAAEKIGD